MPDVRRYRRRAEITAAPYDGTPGAAQAITDWVASTGDQARVHATDDGLEIHTPGGILTVPAGRVATRSSAGEYRAIGPAVLAALYVEVEEPS